jgi:hypothetical protein
MTAWDEYLSAIAELDSARRNSDAAVASQERATAVAYTELGTIRQRIVLQRARLTDVATRAHRPPPLVEPQPSDRTNAANLVTPAVMDPTPGVNAALTAAHAALDAADTLLTIAAEAPSGGGLLPSWEPSRRNLIPYGWYALLAIIALLFINDFTGRSPGARSIAVAFDIAIPVGAYLLAVASIALLFTPDRHGRKPKSLTRGLLICAIPLVVGLAVSVI